MHDQKKSKSQMTGLRFYQTRQVGIKHENKKKHRDLRAVIKKHLLCHLIKWKYWLWADLSNLRRQI